MWISFINDMLVFYLFYAVFDAKDISLKINNYVKRKFDIEKDKRKDNNYTVSNSVSNDDLNYVILPSLCIMNIDSLNKFLFSLDLLKPSNSFSFFSLFPKFYLRIIENYDEKPLDKKSSSIINSNKKDFENYRPQSINLTKCSVFIVPTGEEYKWLFNTDEVFFINLFFSIILFYLNFINIIMIAF
jgi:hypothetical protein